TEPIFVTDAARKVLEGERVSGLGFSRPTLARDPLPGIWQLDVALVLPPALRTHGLKTERCEPITDPDLLRTLATQQSALATGPYCGRIKYQKPSRGLVGIAAAALAGMPDVVLTHEHFGSGGSSGRLTLVSKRFRDVVLAAKLKGAVFRPIE